MDTFRTLTTALFVGSLVISVVTIILLLLISKQYIQFMNHYHDPQRRRYLLSSILSVIAIATLGIKINKDYLDAEQVIVCDGWVLQQKDLKPDACQTEAN